MPRRPPTEEEVKAALRFQAPVKANPTLPDEEPAPPWHDVVKVAWEELPADLAGRLQDRLSMESWREMTPLGQALVDAMTRQWRPVLEAAQKLPLRHKALVHELFGRAIRSCPREPLAADVRCLAEGRMMLWSIEEADDG